MNRRSRSLAIRPLELLDQRLVLSGGGSVAAQEALVTSKGGQILGQIFTDYQNAQASGNSFNTKDAQNVFVAGTSVKVDLTFSGGSTATLTQQLQGIGMTDVSSFTSGTTSTIEGYLPIGQLYTVLTNSHESSVAPVIKPKAFQTPASTSVEQFVSTKGGQILGDIYEEFEAANGAGTINSTLTNQFQIRGNLVEVDVHVTGNLNTLAGQLGGIGMTSIAIDSKNDVIEGYLPINQLPTVLSNSHETSVSPVAVARPL
jgi:hypothetical protein